MEIFSPADCPDIEDLYFLAQFGQISSKLSSIFPPFCKAEKILATTARKIYDTVRPKLRNYSHFGKKIMKIYYKIFIHIPVVSDNRNIFQIYAELITYTITNSVKLAKILNKSQPEYINLSIDKSCSCCYYNELYNKHEHR